MLRTFLYAFVFLFNQVSAEFEEKFISAPGGAELYCKIMGQGSPLIVLHGGAGFLTHDYFLPHLERLAENNLVIFYDQRGLGKSSGDITTDQINLTTYVEDIEVIRKSIGANKIALLGHSWGGFLGMHYAFAHPESVDQLILVGTMPVSTSDLGLFFAELGKRFAPYQEELDKIAASELYLSGDPSTVVKNLSISFQTYMYHPENINKLNLWMPQAANLRGLKVWDIFRENVFMKPYDLTPELKKLTCPTLIIHGDADIIPFVTAEHIHAVIPGSKLVKIDQCGHFPFVEQPEAFFKALNGK